MKWLTILISPVTFFYVINALILKSGIKGKILLIRMRHHLDKSVSIGDLRIVGKNLHIGMHTYFNSGHIATAPDAAVKIGKWCAIGHNVTILAITHHTGIPTGGEKQRPSKKGDVIIEDGVWIGSNVIITPGVTIGRQAVIGGNAVVAKDIPPFAVCAGIPCRALYFKKEDEIEAHNKLMV